MRARSFALAAALALVAATGARAHGLSVPLNHSVRLPLAGPAQSVVVGSPSVIDVSVVDSRTVFVSGKAPGSTDVTVIDPLGRVVYRGDVSVAGGASVSVFRGPARTDATCAPYCHDLSGDEAAAAGAASASGRAATASGGAGGVGAPAASAMNSLAAGSLPSTVISTH